MEITRDSFNNRAVSFTEWEKTLNIGAGILMHDDRRADVLLRRESKEFYLFEKLMLRKNPSV
jgi:hypothetical protein